jgi:transcriptional regulator with XRE-family HTH domain
MVNYYDKHLFISKKKLAELAGVSRYTFSRYLKSRRHILETMGVSLHARLLPPQAVKYICEDYCIDLPQELQDQKVIASSPLYQKLIRELQLNTFFEGKWTKVTEIPHDF